MSVTHILIYGRDSTLLQTRRWLLEQARYAILTAETQECALEILKAEPVDLCILCHTLSDIQRRNLKTIAHELWPTVKIMQLITSFGKQLATTSENTLSTGDGPAALLYGVQRAMSLPLTTRSA